MLFKLGLIFSCFIWQAVQLGPSEQRFVLEGLEQGAKYTIFVMAYKGDRQSRKTDSTFSTGRIKPWCCTFPWALQLLCFMVKVRDGVPVLQIHWETM